MDATQINTGDTAWILISAALVMLMTPGLAFFYGGLVHRKNMINTLMMSFIALGIIAIEWAVIGYSLAFAPGNAWIGGLDFLALENVGLTAQEGSTIPHVLFMVFQMMFAIITPALISGAIVGRMKFKAYVLFILLWGLLIYNPLCHWVWGGGWLGADGALDADHGAPAGDDRLAVARCLLLHGSLRGLRSSLGTDGPQGFYRERSVRAPLGSPLWGRKRVAIASGGG